MKNFAQLWGSVTTAISEHVVTSQRKPPSTLQIPLDHTDRQAQMSDPFLPDQDYFQVRINQLYLADERKWFTEVDPMVFVVSEFLYNKAQQSVPYVVGPSMMKEFGQKLPHGMIFSDTRVAGLHPYCGDAVTLSVVLCQVPVGSPAQTFLGVIERAASALDFGSALGTYLTIGKVLLDGFDSLFGLKGIQPLIGLRKTVDPQAGDTLRPAYYALIDDGDVPIQELWVCENTLMRGSSMDTAQPYRDSDFVLYSLVRQPDKRRTDVQKLDFYDLYQRALSDAISNKPGAWDNAKGSLITLVNNLTLSPDLIPAQAKELTAQYIESLKTAHEQVNMLGNLSMKAAEPDQLEEARNLATSIMTL